QHPTDGRRREIFLPRESSPLERFAGRREPVPKARARTAGPVAPPLISRGANLQIAAAALALARGDHERRSLRRLFPAVQLRLALLDRAHAIARGALVFARTIEAPLASRCSARLCRGHFVFLE